ncbi:MAG: mechanosensitive ion channel family protein [Rhodobacteraceae bacterium]|nr:mechanosensitive ion channel family protein [Paracoccaceae bacterium]
MMMRLLWMWSVWLGLALLLAGGASAQEDAPQTAVPQTAVPQTNEQQILSGTQSEQYAIWLDLSKQAQAAVDDPNSSNAVLQVTRERMVRYRDRFSKLRNENSDRINTLKTQLETLGPKPAEGEEPEPVQVAEIRERIESELEALRVPVILAEESRIRATGIISEIDTILTERLRLRLLRRDPTPLSFGNLRTALDDLARSSFLMAETRAMLATPKVQEQLRNRAPALLLALAMGLFLMVRGLRLSDLIETRLTQMLPRMDLVWHYLGRALRVLVPYSGLLIFVSVLTNSGAMGPKSLLVLEHVPIWGAVLIGFTWLSYTLFSQRNGPAYFDVTPAQAAQMYGLAVASAVVLIAFDFLRLFNEVEVVSQATQSVARFPLIVLLSLLIFRAQQIAFRADRMEPSIASATSEEKGTTDSLPLLRRLMVFLLMLSCIGGGLGYLELAQAIVIAISLSLVLIGAILVIQNWLGRLLIVFFGGAEGGRAQLFSAITSILLWVVSAPLFAVIWGVRTTQLLEIWTDFLEGIQFGETRISPTVFVALAVFFGIGVVVTRLVQSTLANRVLPKTRIDPGGQAAIVSGIGYVGYAIAALVAVTGAGLDLSNLAIVAGALSVGIGFGLQTVVSNFVSGIILLIERPVSKGDWISVGENMGYVRDIAVRSTRIETFDRTDVIIPNSDLISGTVVNYTRGNTVGRAIVPVGVAYGTDTRRVEAILREIANAHPMVLANPAPAVVFQGFGADSLNFEIRAILRDVNWVLTVKSDMNHEIAHRFAKEGIEIPFRQQDIWLRNPEVLQGGSEFAGTSRHNFTHESPGDHIDLADIDPDADGDADGPR